MPEPLTFRTKVAISDRAIVLAMVEATGFFSREEILVAVELVDECLARGVEASGYAFVFAEAEGEVVGYACFGPVPATVGSYDLYWIVVDPRVQARGIGRALMAQVEREIDVLGGGRIWVDTSERPQYAPTRAFYRSCGYSQAASLADFYAAGDGKAIFVKPIAAGDLVRSRDA